MATLTQTIGRRLRATREKCGATQEHVAAAARSVGLDWGRSTVAQVEAGTKPLSAEEFLLLPVFWRSAFGVESSHEHLFRPSREELGDRDKWIELTPDARITDRAGRDLVSGRFPHTADLDVPATRTGRAAAAIARIETVERRRWAERAARGEAEQKAARKLGVSALRLTEVARARWGHSLTEERDRRVGAVEAPSSLRARRGHITRELLKELQPLLREDDHSHGTR